MSSYEFLSSKSSVFHLGSEGTTAGSGTDSTGHEGGYSSSESDWASRRNSTFVRVARLWGTQRSLDGSFPTSCTSDIIGASNPTVNWDGAVGCSEEGKMPCVRR